MDFDLESILERLCLSTEINTKPETHKGLIFEVKENLSLIDELLCTRDRLILVQKSESEVSVGDEIYVNNRISQLDLTGSPLKDNYRDEDLEITDYVNKTSLTYRAINLKDARWLISMYNRHRYNLPIGIICDGMRENIIFLGATCRDKELNWRIVSLHSVKENPRNSLENVKLRHNVGLKCKKIDKFEVSSSYDLTCLPVTGNLNCKENYVTINFNWNNCKTILELPSGNASCTLKMKLISSRMDSIIHNSYEELQILEKLANHKQFYVGDITTEENVTKVKNKLTDLFQDLIKTSIIGKRNSTTERTDKLLPFLVRQRAFDVTDQLWSILKDYHYMPNLIHSCLEFTRSEWKRIRHVLFKDNMTKLVQLFSQENQAIILTEQLCSELLFDIGIKKLQREYTNCLIDSALATMDLLDNFVNPTCVTYFDMIENLKRLHYTIDVISTSDVTLNLNSQQLRIFTRHVLSEMRSKSFGDVIEYPIPTHLVLPLISREKLVKWQLCLSSDENLYKKMTIYQINRSWPNWIQNNEEYCHVIYEEIWDQNVI